MPDEVARSITRSGIRRPRIFSATAQKMCPPSSGSNGNRLMSPSASEISARISMPVVQPAAMSSCSDLVAADDAVQLPAVLRLEDLDDVGDLGLGHVPQTCGALTGGVEDAVRREFELEADADQHLLFDPAPARAQRQGLQGAFAAHHDRRRRLCPTTVAAGIICAPVLVDLCSEALGGPPHAVHRHQDITGLDLADRGAAGDHAADPVGDDVLAAAVDDVVASDPQEEHECQDQCESDVDGRARPRSPRSASTAAG